MSRFDSTRRLLVSRTLSSGQTVQVGTLAQNREGVYFAYEPEYIQQYSHLSPYHLRFDTSVQLAPTTPHNGLHGVFADCLPDGWGLLLQDRYFRQNGILPHQVSSLDRLAFVGNRAIGALSFEPMSYEEDMLSSPSYAELGLAAQAVFDGQTDEVLQSLIQAGSSGGARPKAQIYISPHDKQNCRTIAQARDEAWLIKFTSRNLPLGHEEGLCEATYLHLAKQANLHPCEWQLLDAPPASGASQWLALKRFDWVAQTQGRYHVHSVSGLLHADYRLPSLDYSDLLKMSKQLCQSPAIGQLQFARAIFNLLFANQDDHAKNWAFIQDDQGNWQAAPFYDITFSPTRFNEHTTAFGGYGKAPPLKTMQQLADQASFNSWFDAKQVIQEIADTTQLFTPIALEFGVSKTTCKLIQQYLNQVWQENKGLLT